MTTTLNSACVKSQKKMNFVSKNDQRRGQTIILQGLFQRAAFILIISFQHFIHPLQGHGGAGAYSSCLQVRGRVHPAQVASLSQDQHTGTKELKFYSCLSKTSPTEKHSDGLRRFNCFFVLLFKLRAADAEARHVGHIRHNMEG